MAKIFWATCPTCGREVCAVRELLVNNWELRCPYCHGQFRPSEARRIVS